MSELSFALVAFAVLWVMTFYPSWILLLKLLALSASPRKMPMVFWGWLLLYRVLIALPYVVLLIAGSDVLPTIIQIIVVGFIAAGFILSVIRLAFRPHLITGLWWVYGYVYDGLLHFAPYRRLIAVVVATARSVSEQPTRIVELGCGSGNVLRSLTDAYPDVVDIIGVDNSESMLRNAQKKVPSARIVTADIVEFLRNASDSSADLVVMQNSLYVVNDRDSLWRELHRVLDSNGIVVITNSDRPGSSTITKEHLRYGTWYELLHPKLMLVGVIDAYISQLSKAGSFHFIKKEDIARETHGRFSMSETKRCYGDVNILFTLQKV